VIRVAKHLPLPPRDLRRPHQPLDPANRFRLKRVALELTSQAMRAAWLDGPLPKGSKVILLL
jgi:hypothetical protein